MMFDIAFTGTSLTTGYASRDWKLHALARLQAGTDKTLRFYDLGRPSSSSDWGLANIHNVVKTRARVAVFEWSFNDAALMTLAQSEANTRAIIAAIQTGSPDTRIIMQTMNPALVEAAIARPNLAGFYQLYRDLATEYGFTLIDNAPLWGASSLVEIPDGGHPTLAGLQRVTIPNVVETLRPLIEAP